MMDQKDLRVRFVYHAPRKDQVPRYEKLRAQVFELALLFDRTCPDSREKSLALTKLEEAVMWANASIAREGAFPETPGAPVPESLGKEA